MTIYSFYIYDRHCTCVYYQDWHRTRRPKTAAPGGLLPAVSRAVSPAPSHSEATGTPFTSPRNTLSSSTGVVVAVGDSASQQLQNSPTPQPPQPATSSSGLPFDEEAKLVYGVILSLRNMAKKLSSSDELFTSYRTSTYRLHLYETLSGYKFVMLGDPASDGLRRVMHQIYIGPFVEYVVRNPLSTMDSKEQGIDNEYFRASVDRLVRGMPMFL